jgi:hypothetical protein
MSIDRRLRESFRSALTDVEDDLDVEGHLRRAVERARPRQIARRAGTFVMTVSIAGSLFAAGVLTERGLHGGQPLDRPPRPPAAPASGALPTPLDGFYGVRITVEDGRDAGLRHAEAFGISGEMDAWFSRNTIRIEQRLGSINLLPVAGTMEVTGPRLVVRDDNGITTLAWRPLADGRIRFRVLDDSRTGIDRIVNRVLWTAHPWTLLSR